MHDGMLGIRPSPFKQAVCVCPLAFCEPGLCY
jgi:hypothetical protein